MIPEWIKKPNPDIFLSDNYVVIDFETTNIDKGSPRNSSNRIVMASWSVGSGHVRYKKSRDNIQSKFGGEFTQGDLTRAIDEADFIVAQNTKFELEWLMRCGVNLHEVLPYDTIIGKYVQDGNRISARDLSGLARYYGVDAKESLVDRMIKAGICPSVIPRSLLQRYCEQDVRATEAIFLKQRAQLKENGLLPVTFTRNIFTPVLCDIEVNGLYLDSEIVEQLYNDKVKEFLAVESELATFSEGINWGSPQQIAHYLYEDLGFEEIKDRSGNFIRNKPSKQFPNGVPKTDVDTLALLKPKNRRQKRLLELKNKYSKLSKSLSTYLSLFKDACDENNCWLFGTFNQCITQTHRLSSSKPNFQNFDRLFKKVFTSRNRSKGWKIGERDAAQLEFRAAAYYGDDKRAREDIAEKADIHSFTASIIHPVQWAKVSGDLNSPIRKRIRTDVKEHTFKPLYGGTSGTEREREYYKSFKIKYEGITGTQNQWVNDVLQTKKFVLPTGLVFYFPKIKMTSSGYIEGNNNVRNYPIQYLATAEIIPIGITYVWHHMKDRDMNTLLVNTVHDSMITDEDPAETEELNDITEHAFSEETIKYLDQVYDIQFDIPLEIETEINQNWSYTPEELKNAS